MKDSIPEDENLSRHGEKSSNLHQTDILKLQWPEPKIVVNKSNEVSTQHVISMGICT